MRTAGRQGLSQVRKEEPGAIAVLELAFLDGACELLCQREIGRALQM